MQLVEATIRVNDNQKLKMVQKIEEAMVELEGKKLAVLGLTFKPKTDDMRDAPSLTIIRELAKKGVTLNVYDPIGMHEAKAVLTDVESIRYCMDEYEAIEDCDGVIIVTEWHQFRNLDLERLKSGLKAPFFFDFRNIYDKQRMIQLGFYYFGVGVS